MKAPEGYWQGRRHRFYKPDREWLYREYITNGRPSREIAEETGAWQSTITNWLRDAGLTPLTPEVRSKRHSGRMSDERNPAWNGGTPQYYRKKLAKTSEPRCLWCDTTERVVMHHVDHDRTNHADDNLIWLCRKCHWAETALYPAILDGRATWNFDETKHELTIKFRRQ